MGLASTLVAHRGDLTEEQVDDCLERIRVQGDRLARLVGDLLDLAQIDSGQFQVALEPVDLAAAGRRTLDDVPAPPGRLVEVAIPADVWVVADPSRLEQVLVNLLMNAYRHGGPNIRLGARRTPDGVYVEVSDDGVGVPEGARAKSVREVQSRGERRRRRRPRPCNHAGARRGVRWTGLVRPR